MSCVVIYKESVGYLDNLLELVGQLLEPLTHFGTMPYLHGALLLLLSVARTHFPRSSIVLFCSSY